ncbi:hypothetical protein C8Q76DRAFT_198816 [Earliella scabrosa]|nr:hypothetical protein C8Q76DRAFT_198816 [Earliella scabrosa]
MGISRLASTSSPGMRPEERELWTTPRNNGEFYGAPYSVPQAFTFSNTFTLVPMTRPFFPPYCVSSTDRFDDSRGRFDLFHRFDADKYPLLEIIPSTAYPGRDEILTLNEVAQDTYDWMSGVRRRCAHILSPNTNWNSNPYTSHFPINVRGNPPAFSTATNPSHSPSPPSNTRAVHTPTTTHSTLSELIGLEKLSDIRDVVQEEPETIPDLQNDRNAFVASSPPRTRTAMPPLRPTSSNIRPLGLCSVRVQTILPTQSYLTHSESIDRQLATSCLHVDVPSRRTRHCIQLVPLLSRVQTADGWGTLLPPAS